MKQNRKETVNTGSEITFVKRAGTALGAGAIAMLAVGAVGFYAFVGGNSIPVNEDSGSEAETTSTTVSEAAVTVKTDSTSSEAPEVSAVFEGYERSVSRAAVTIRKAGLDEYDLFLETVQATEAPEVSKKADTEVKEADADGDGSDADTANTKKNTKSSKTKSKKTDTSSEAEVLTDNTDIEAAEKSAEESGETKKTKKKAKTVKLKQNSDGTKSANEPQSEVKACAAMTVYSVDKVNLRTEPSLDADVIVVLPVDAEVIVTGYTEDWYRVKYDGESGYCMKKYFTDAVPVASGETAAVEQKGDVISYNSTEFDMLCYVLQGEVGNCSEASKIAVANVIINRVKDPRFPDTIEGVLTQPAQFDAIYGYYGGYTVPSENTIECAKRALAGEDNTGGAIYYYAPQYVGGDVASWFESLQFCLELDGQRYFK